MGYAAGVYEAFAVCSLSSVDFGSSRLCRFDSPAQRSFESEVLLNEPYLRCEPLWPVYEVEDWHNDEQNHYTFGGDRKTWSIGSGPYMPAISEVLITGTVWLIRFWICFGTFVVTHRTMDNRFLLNCTKLSWTIVSMVFIGVRGRKIKVLKLRYRSSDRTSRFESKCSNVIDFIKIVCN